MLFSPNVGSSNSKQAIDSRGARYYADKVGHFSVEVGIRLIISVICLSSRSCPRLLLLFEITHQRLGGKPRHGKKHQSRTILIVNAKERVFRYNLPSSGSTLVPSDRSHYESTFIQVCFE